MEDLKRTIALLFRRKGRERMTEREFVLSASMDLRWFPPKEAQRLLDLSVKRGFLTLAEGGVEPTFDVKALEVPLAFVPTPEVLRDEGDLFDRILDTLAGSSSVSPKVLVARLNEIRARMGIHAEVAALLAGQEVGVDVSPLIPDVEEMLEERRS